MKTNNMVVVAVTPPRIWTYSYSTVVNHSRFRDKQIQLASLMSNRNSHKLLKILNSLFKLIILYVDVFFGKPSCNYFLLCSLLVMLVITDLINSIFYYILCKYFFNQNLFLLSSPYEESLFISQYLPKEGLFFCLL